MGGKHVWQRKESVKDNEVQGPTAEELVVRLREYFECERENNGPLISLNKVTQRVSDALGVSRKLVARLSNNIKAVDSRLQLPKQTYDMEKINKHIADFYCRNPFATPEELMTSLSDNGVYFGNYSSLFLLCQESRDKKNILDSDNDGHGVSNSESEFLNVKRTYSRPKKVNESAVSARTNGFFGNKKAADSSMPISVPKENVEPISNEITHMQKLADNYETNEPFNEKSSTEVIVTIEKNTFGKKTNPAKKVSQRKSSKHKKSPWYSKESHAPGGLERMQRKLPVYYIVENGEVKKVINESPIKYSKKRVTEKNDDKNMIYEEEIKIESDMEDCIILNETDNVQHDFLRQTIEDKDGYMPSLCKDEPNERINWIKKHNDIEPKMLNGMDRSELGDEIIDCLNYNKMFEDKDEEMILGAFDDNVENIMDLSVVKRELNPYDEFFETGEFSILP